MSYGLICWVRGCPDIFGMAFFSVPTARNREGYDRSGIIHCRCGWYADPYAAAMQSCQGLLRVRAELNLEHQNKLLEEACLYSSSVLPSTVIFFCSLYECNFSNFSHQDVFLRAFLRSWWQWYLGKQGIHLFLPRDLFLNNTVLNRRKPGERLISWAILDLEHRHLALAKSVIASIFSPGLSGTRSHLGRMLAEDVDGCNWKQVVSQKWKSASYWNLLGILISITDVLCGPEFLW